MSINPYSLTAEQVDDLDNRFTYHNPRGHDIADRYVLIRDTGKALADVVMKNAPVSRELSLAVTKIEEAIMWANSAIARHE